MLINDMTNNIYVKGLLKDAKSTNRNVYFNPYNDKAVRVIGVKCGHAILMNGTKIDLNDRHIMGSDFYIN